MKFLLDANLSIRWEQLFLHAGLHAVHWSRLGPPDASDQIIMAHAAEHDWIVVTHDLGFASALIFNRSARPSIVQIRGGDMDPTLLGHQVVSVIRSVRARP